MSIIDHSNTAHSIRSEADLFFAKGKSLLFPILIGWSESVKRHQFLHLYSSPAKATQITFPRIFPMLIRQSMDHCHRQTVSPHLRRAGYALTCCFEPYIPWGCSCSLCCEPSPCSRSPSNNTICDTVHRQKQIGAIDRTNWKRDRMGKWNNRSHL